MKQQKMEIAVLFSIIPLGLFISNTLISTYPDIDFIWCIVLTSLMGILIMFIMLLLCINMGNCVKTLYFRIKGYSLFPLLLYPLFFYRDNTTSKVYIKFVFDWTAAFRDLYPNDFIKEYQHKSIDETGTRYCVNSLKIRAVTRIILLVVIGSIISVYFKSVMLALFFIGLIYFFYCVSMLNTKYYHGEFQKCKNIKSNNIILYLAKELCVYGLSDHQFYNDFNLWISKVNCNDFDNFIATTVKHMCVEEISSGVSIIGGNVKKYIDNCIIYHGNIKLGLYDESWELLKAYMLYCKIKKDETELNYVIQELRFLRLELGGYLQKFYDVINYYIDIATDKIELDSKKYPLFAIRDRFCTIAPEYEFNAYEMENKVVNIKI